MIDFTEFNVKAFIEQAEEEDSIAEDFVETRIRTLRTMRLILDNDEATPELLDQCSITDIEWAFDLVLYWPSAEMELEPHDWDHDGIQQVQLMEIIDEIRQEKSIRKKVTFI